MKLNLVINHKPGVKITGSDLEALSAVKDIEVIEVGTMDTVAKSGEYILEQNIILTSFDSGYYWLPKIPVNFIQSNGEAGQAMTRELPLTVNTIEIQSDSVELAPIKPIIEEPLKFRDALPFLIGLAIIAFLGGLIYYFVRRRKLKEAEPEPEIKRPAHEIAEEKLEALKAAKLWQQGKVKEYQSELTYIVREYLENRFEINALENTTYEIMRQLKSHKDIKADWSIKLRKMLETADLVKFAKAEPPIDIHAEVMENAYAFVRQTKKIELPVEEGVEDTPKIENENE